LETIGFWISPLLLLHGAGLLVMSTSQRFNRLHDEIHHLLNDKSEMNKETYLHLLRPANYFKNALVLLYISISLFATAGLVGGITSGLTNFSFYVTVALTIIGIFCLAAASILLIKESTLSLQIMKIHLKEIGVK
jgi:hypothetical protein